MSYHYRCSIKRKCGARKTLPKQIEMYTRRPLCPSCKKDTLKADPAVKRQRKRWKLCRCDGLEWPQRNGPHRKGSSVWCIHHPIGPTDEDHRQRHG